MGDPTKEVAAMPAKFVMKQSPKKGFRWSLVATNGRVIATSQFYETRRAAMAGVESARKNAPTAVVVAAEDLKAASRPIKDKTRHRAAEPSATS